VFLTASSRRGDGESDAALQVASIKTLVGALDTIPAPHLIIPDECHHAPAANGERSSIASQTHTPSGSRRRLARAEIERIERWRREPHGGRSLAELSAYAGAREFPNGRAEPLQPSVPRHALTLDRVRATTSLEFGSPRRGQPE
jgi:hypothetical protein